MTHAIQITLTDGRIVYVEDEYGTTPDLQRARMSLNDKSVGGLLRKWERMIASGNWPLLTNATVTAVPVVISLA